MPITTSPSMSRESPILDFLESWGQGSVHRVVCMVSIEDWMHLLLVTCLHPKLIAACRGPVPEYCGWEGLAPVTLLGFSAVFRSHSPPLGLCVLPLPPAPTNGDSTLGIEFQSFHLSITHPNLLMLCFPNLYCYALKA